mmetsp:Transcript_31218/g.50091  ORF Transcript_31218/g.50091 Transcript_31218/m.50091 type:complete len:81 (-) Transcript_31218:401-643(-)
MHPTALPAAQEMSKDNPYPHTLERPECHSAYQGRYQSHGAGVGSSMSTVKGIPEETMLRQAVEAINQFRFPPSEHRSIVT